jgi:hypothetical protein
LAAEGVTGAPGAALPDATGLVARGAGVFEIEIAGVGSAGTEVAALAAADPDEDGEDEACGSGRLSAATTTR